MASFFEKLKKGMGIEVPVEEEEPKERPKTARKKGRPKKLEIKAELIEPAVEEKKTEEKAVEEEVKKPEEPRRKSGRAAGKLESSVETPETKKQIEVKKGKWFEPEGQLAVDVYQTNGELVIQSTIAGVKPEDLDISIEADRVLIKGSRLKPSEEEERNYFYQECYWGPFSREIILPEEADPTRAEATMKEGILTIRIPIIERKKKRKIVVKG